MQSLCLTPFRAGPASRQRPPLHTRTICRAIKAPQVLTDIEKKALMAYRSIAFDTSKSFALQLLKRAASTKEVPAEAVEGALLTVEQLSSLEENGPTPVIAGRWRLVFGTATKFRPFQYIPVQEDFVLDDASKTLALESSVGPFEFFIRGEMSSWRPETGELGFQFKQVDIHLAGSKRWQVNPKTKPKTYTFFHVGADLACARSRAGGVALLTK